MKGKLTLALLLAVIVCVLTAPVWSALRVRHRTLPAGSGVCIQCGGEATGLWVQQGSRRKMRVKCSRVEPGWRRKETCRNWRGKVITLRKGDELILTAGGGSETYLAGSMLWPGVFWVHCYPPIR